MPSAPALQRRRSASPQPLPIRPLAHSKINNACPLRLVPGAPGPPGQDVPTASTYTRVPSAHLDGDVALIGKNLNSRPAAAVATKPHVDRRSADPDPAQLDMPEPLGNHRLPKAQCRDATIDVDAEQRLQQVEDGG